MGATTSPVPSPPLTAVSPGPSIRGRPSAGIHVLEFKIAMGSGNTSRAKRFQVWARGAEIADLARTSSYAPIK
jgi:hypothetical protein